MRNESVDSIIDGLNQVNESVNKKLLDRFIKYCKAANASNIGAIEYNKEHIIYGISLKRFAELAKGFAKTNNLIFEYDLGDTLKVTRLETRMN